MRLLLLGGVLGLVLPLADALAQSGPGPATPPASSAPKRQPAATPSTSNAEARRAEEERHKRWQQRMQRATRSLCDRC